VTSEELPPPGIDTTRPSIARVYDFMLGGKDNFAADREAAERWFAENWVEPPELRVWEFAIADAETDEFLGTMMFHSLHWRHKRAEIGAWIAEDARDRGVGKAAFQLLLDWAFDDLGLAASTNIIVSSDHGFSTISKESKTSPSAKISYEDTPKDFLPMGFLAIDLAKALNLPLFDPNNKNASIGDNAHPKAGNGVLGQDPAKPDVVIATNGGSDLIYLPNKDKKLAERTVKALLEQDYVSGLFVDDELGRFPGTLPMSQLGLKGKAVTPHPAIVVNFRSWSSGCEEPLNCSVQVADTVLRQGQGMHGSFSRGDTMNFMAAIGPDFKAGYVDPLPVSNADVGMTAARLLDLHAAAEGGLIGRVMSEALPNGIIPKAASGTIASKPASNGLKTVVKFQQVLAQRYFDAAGFPGRTVGLDAEGGKQKTAGK